MTSANGKDHLLRTVIARATGRDVSALRPEDSLRRVLGLDTADMVRILVAAEQAYGVECDPRAVYRLDRYGDLMAALGIGPDCDGDRD